jgi:hypothetical protein
VWQEGLGKLKKINLTHPASNPRLSGLLYSALTTFKFINLLKSIPGTRLFSVSPGHLNVLKTTNGGLVFVIWCVRNVAIKVKLTPWRSMWL